MLPFLKNNKDASISVPAEHQMRKRDEGSEYDALEAAAEDIMSAIKSNSIKDLAAALRAAFELCDAEPHEEGEHTNENKENE